MRENRPSGSEGGAGESPFRPLSQVAPTHGNNQPAADALYIYFFSTFHRKATGEISKPEMFDR